MPYDLDEAVAMTRAERLVDVQRQKRTTETSATSRTPERLRVDFPTMTQAVRHIPSKVGFGAKGPQPQGLLMTASGHED
jgi:hypothetical protein